MIALIKENVYVMLNIKFPIKYLSFESEENANNDKKDRLKLYKKLNLEIDFRRFLGDIAAWK